MTITTTAHLNFRGNARTALEFYQSVFGGQTMLLSYRDANAVIAATEADQIMWGQVESADGFRVMAYDVPSHLGYDAGEIPMFMSVRGDDAEAIKAYWARLSVGGTVIQPIGPAAWSPLYGMVRDQFGVTWVVDLAVAYGG